MAHRSALITASEDRLGGVAATDVGDALTDPPFLNPVFLADDVSAARRTEAETAGGARGVEDVDGRRPPPRDARTAARSAARTSPAIPLLALGGLRWSAGDRPVAEDDSSLLGAISLRGGARSCEC